MSLAPILPCKKAAVARALIYLFGGRHVKNCFFVEAKSPSQRLAAIPTPVIALPPPASQSAKLSQALSLFIQHLLRTLPAVKQQ